MAEPCEHCGIVDALDRHDPMCGHAISLGLPRLAEGEEPIDPDEDLGPIPDRELEELPEDTVLLERPEPVARERRRVSELWFSYGEDLDDLIIHESEIDALRYAVTNGHKARRLELGRSIQAQVEDAR